MGRYPYLLQSIQTYTKAETMEIDKGLLTGDLVANKRSTLWVSRVVKDCSRAAAALEETDDSLDDPEGREDSKDES